MPAIKIHRGVRPSCNEQYLSKDTWLTSGKREEQNKTPEKTIDSDDRRPVDPSLIQSRYRSICRLTISANGKQYLGTGFLLAADMIMTAAHNLKPFSSVTIDLAVHGTTPAVATRTVDMDDWFVPPNYPSDKFADFGLIKLNRPFQLRQNQVLFRPLEITPQTHSRLAVERLQITGYPLTVCLPPTNKCVYNFPNQMYLGQDDYSNLTSLPTKFPSVVLHQIDTSPGQSGAPLFAYKLPVKEGDYFYAPFIGVHISSYNGGPFNLACLVTKQMRNAIATFAPHVSNWRF